VPFVDTNGIHLHYEVYGDGEPLVLISPFAAPAMAWFFQVRAFKKHYRVVAFDNRGVGRSSKRGGPYTTKMMAEDTLALMDHLGIAQANILGYSMGSMIAREIAINHPERVRKLILGAMPVVRNSSDAGMVRLHAIGLKENLSESDAREVVKIVTAMSFKRLSFRLFFGLVMKIFPMPVSPRGVFGQFMAAESYDLDDKLEQIKAQTLVVVGTEDSIAPEAYARKVVGSLPNARLVTVDGGSHILFMENSRRFNGEVLTFLKGSLYTVEESS
jgi:pimeloyl-ACP methyl ester carboxylesterase